MLVDIRCKLFTTWLLWQVGEVSGSYKGLNLFAIATRHVYWYIYTVIVQAANGNFTVPPTAELSLWLLSTWSTLCINIYHILHLFFPQGNTVLAVSHFKTMVKTHQWMGHQNLWFCAKYWSIFHRLLLLGGPLILIVHNYLTRQMTSRTCWPKEVKQNINICSALAIGPHHKHP